jgi:hypothetical protein
MDEIILNRCKNLILEKGDGLVYNDNGTLYFAKKGSSPYRYYLRDCTTKIPYDTSDVVIVVDSNKNVSVFPLI